MPSPKPETSDSSGSPGKTFAALGLRNYRLFWIGGLISNTGRWFQTLAIPAITWQLTENAGWVGLAGFAQMIPMAVVAPLAGALADRHDRRRLLIVTQSVQALSTAVLMSMWAAGVRSPTAYVATAAVAGLGGGLNLPAWQAFVSELVPRELMLNAITLNSMQFNSSRMFGPVLAGVVLASAGPAWAFFVNLVSFSGVLVALVLIDTRSNVVAEKGSLRPIRDFVDTISYVRGEPGIAAAITVVMIVGFFGFSLQVLSVVFAEEVFDRGPSGFGWMLTMMGAGAVLASPVVASLGGRLPRSKIQSVALGSYALAVMAFALAPTFLIALFALMLVGASHLTTASTLNTTIQLHVEDSRRAKVLSVYFVVLLVASPVGQLSLGQLMQTFGPRPVVFGAGVTMLVAGGALVASGRLAALDDGDGDYVPQVAPEVHPTYPVPPTRPVVGPR